MCGILWNTVHIFYYPYSITKWSVDLLLSATEWINKHFIFVVFLLWLIQIIKTMFHSMSTKTFFKEIIKKKKVIPLQYIYSHFFSIGFFSVKILVFIYVWLIIYFLEKSKSLQDWLKEIWSLCTDRWMHDHCLLLIQIKLPLR